MRLLIVMIFVPGTTINNRSKKNGTAIHADDGHIKLRGKRVPKRATKGSKICVKWKDGSTLLVDL